MSIAEPITVPAVALPPRSIKINDVRFLPENFVVPVQPGATIIRGPCGAGKSILLEAIGLGLGCDSKGRVQPAEDAKRATIDCLGVLVNVTASKKTRLGDSEVGAYEEFDLGDLIDPPYKGDDARNGHGIKALLKISDAKADAAMFYDLAGGKEPFEQLVAPAALKTDDLVEMARRVKAAFDKKAREESDAAEREEGKAAALRNAGDGLDLTAETDQAKLNAALSEAMQRQATLDAQAKAAKAARENAAVAREQLAKATGSTKTVAEFEQLERVAKDEYADARTKADELKRQWDLAKIEAQSAYDRVENATAQVNAARQTEKAMAGWQKAIEAAEGVAAPADEDLAAARAATIVAQQAIERAGVVRDAQRKLREAAEHAEAAAQRRKADQELRDKGKLTDDVLSKAVASSRFAVSKDILFGVLPNGVRKPYYVMSDGERTMIALAEKVERTRALTPDPGRPIVVRLPQRTLQDIPQSVRDRIFGMAAALNACVISAQVDDGELRCEVWQANGGAR